MHFFGHRIDCTMDTMATAPAEPSEHAERVDEMTTHFGLNVDKSRDDHILSIFTRFVWRFYNQTRPFFKVGVQSQKPKCCSLRINFSLQGHPLCGTHVACGCVRVGHVALQLLSGAMAQRGLLEKRPGVPRWSVGSMEIGDSQHFFQGLACAATCLKLLNASGIWVNYDFGSFLGPFWPPAFPISGSYMKHLLETTFQ